MGVQARQFRTVAAMDRKNRAAPIKLSANARLLWRADANRDKRRV
jgi:hypothetical protein